MLEDVKTQSILLLTAHFSHARNETVKPLTISEWNRFANWLRNRDLKPWDLVIGNVHDRLKEWSDKSITLERLEGLLNRGTALALAMEKWTGAGLWIMTRSEFPERFRRRLGASAPIIVFGCGDRALLRDGGLAVIGSRNAEDEDLAYSSAIGAMAAQTDLPVISGGARGVDKYAMLGALSNKGIVIGVLADNLLQASSSALYRKYLIEERLVLISSFTPEAGFNIGSAMERNKYIYCLSDRALVVCSDKKGGTWNGANENLKKRWVPLLVKHTANKKAGNEDIVESGGEWAPKNINDVVRKALVSSSSPDPTLSDVKSRLAVGESVKPCTEYQAIQPAEMERGPLNEVIPTGNDVGGVSSDLNELAQLTNDDVGFYKVFLSKVKFLCKDGPMNRTQLADKLQLQKTQLDTWLKKAVEEGKLEKLQKPVRYLWKSTEQGSIFG